MRRRTSLAAALTSLVSILLAAVTPAGAIEFRYLDADVNSIVCSINDHDQIAASGDYPWGQCRLARVGKRSGTMDLRNLRDSLDPLGSGLNVLTTDVTPDGLVAGTVEAADPASGTIRPPAPFVYDFGTGTRHAVDIGDAETGEIESANDRAGFVGFLGIAPASSTSWSGAHAVAWSSVTAAPTTLADLGFGSKAFAINADGEAVGFAQNSEGTFDPFVWNIATGMGSDLVGALGSFPYAPYLGAQLDDEGHALFFREPHGGTVAYGVRDGRVHVFTNPIGPGGDVYSQLSADGVVTTAYQGATTVGPDLVSHVPTQIDRYALRTGATTTVVAGDNLLFCAVNDVGQVLYGQGGEPGTLKHSYLVDPYAGTIELDPDTHSRLALRLNNAGLLAGLDWDSLYHAWVGEVPLAPLPPTLTAVALADGVHLTWQAPPIAGRRPVLSYDIRRNGELIATVDASTTSYVDLGIPVAVGESVTYTLTAVNGHGSSTEATASVAALEDVATVPPAAVVVVTPSFTG